MQPQYFKNSKIEFIIIDIICCGVSSSFQGTLFIVANLGADPKAKKDEATRKSDMLYLRATLILQLVASAVICVGYSMWEWKVRVHAIK